MAHLSRNNVIHPLQSSEIASSASTANSTSPSQFQANTVDKPKITGLTNNVAATHSITSSIISASIESFTTNAKSSKEPNAIISDLPKSSSTQTQILNPNHPSKSTDVANVTKFSEETTTSFNLFRKTNVGKSIGQQSTGLKDKEKGEPQLTTAVTVPPRSSAPVSAEQRQSLHNLELLSPKERQQIRAKLRGKKRLAVSGRQNPTAKPDETAGPKVIHPRPIRGKPNKSKNPSPQTLTQQHPPIHATQKHSGKSTAFKVDNAKHKSEPQTHKKQFISLTLPKQGSLKETFVGAGASTARFETSNQTINQSTGTFSQINKTKEYFYSAVQRQNTPYSRDKHTPQYRQHQRGDRNDSDSSKFRPGPAESDGVAKRARVKSKSTKKDGSRGSPPPDSRMLSVSGNKLMEARSGYNAGKRMEIENNTNSTVASNASQANFAPWEFSIQDLVPAVYKVNPSEEDLFCKKVKHCPKRKTSQNEAVIVQTLLRHDRPYLIPDYIRGRYCPVGLEFLTDVELVQIIMRRMNKQSKQQITKSVF